MNIGVFFGSRSPEHDVSIITGEFIISELKKLGHNISAVYIGKDGQWYCNEELDSFKFFKEQGELHLKNYNKIFLDLEKSKGKIVLKEKGAFGKEYIFDLAFPAFHGSYGEDGTIQGLFEIFNVPYVGCDVASSAITMDKILTKQFYKELGIPTVDFIYFDHLDWQKDRNAIIQKSITELSWPVFVKPPKFGSSIGINKATNKNELEAAIEVALHYGNRVLIEKGVANLKDLTCALLGNENPKVSLVQESLFTDEIFSYEDKYIVEGGTQLGNATSNLVIPANIPENITKEIQELSIKIFKELGCSGTSRVDFLYDQVAKKLYSTEVNTLPGTLYNHLWKASGIEMKDLLSELISLALEKNKKANGLVKTFQSNILEFANSVKLKIKEEQS